MAFMDFQDLLDGFYFQNNYPFEYDIGPVTPGKPETLVNQR